MSKRLFAALATLVCVLFVVAPAQAKTERVIGGHATVTPSSEITSFLRSRGVTVTPIGAMKVGNGSLTMPMVGGQVEVPTMGGTMTTSGGLEYSNGSKHVRITDYVLTHTGHLAKLTAIVNGHRILIATMESPAVKMSGKTGTMSGGLKLSAKWARLINKLVGKRVVHSGEDIGDLTATVKMA
jgi:TPP-dependent indolepyruvate ferredoxin oxidoreductase alpha subunit